MADWYVSSVNYAAIATWAASTAYTVGQFVRPTAPAVTAQMVYRCSVAGTSAGSEPSWGTANGGTTTSGTASFVNVTGQSTYGWSAPAGNIHTLTAPTSRLGSGDRVFCSSDHAQTQSSAAVSITPYTASVVGSAPTLFMSVNKAGSVPPVAADYLAGASIAVTGANNLSIDGPGRWRGFTFDGGANVRFNTATENTVHLRDCTIWLNNATAGSRIQNSATSGAWVWQDVKVRFGAAGQSIAMNASAPTASLDWHGSASGIHASSTMPTSLFTASLGAGVAVSVRGVDFSNMGSGNALVGMAGSLVGTRYTFTGCKLNASASVMTINTTGMGPTVEIINCDSANTNYRSERHVGPQGSITTETTITLSGGASDGVQAFSRKMVTTANVGTRDWPLQGFPMDVWNTATGSSKTATVEIISSLTLTNADITLQLEYPGDSASCLTTVTDTHYATVNELGSASNVTSSSATWNSSPATPVTQKLQITFTPQKVGVVRGIVSLRRASTTVYVDPAMSIA